MPITLRIISYQRLTPGQEDSFSAESNRFSIGRGQENNWTLPDPQRFMSGIHCWLEQRGDKWYLTDTSTNGTYLNGSDDRIEKNQSVALAEGDRIRLGDYELEVELQERAASVPGTDDTLGGSMDEEDIFAVHEEPVSRSPSPNDKPENTPLSQMDNGLLGEGVSIDDLYGLGAEEKEASTPPSLSGRDRQTSPMDEHFSAPRVAGARPEARKEETEDDLPEKYAPEITEIPENWDEDTGLVQVGEKSARAESPEPAAPGQHDPAPDTVEPPDAESPLGTDKHERDVPEPRDEPVTAHTPRPVLRPGPSDQSSAHASALAAFAAGCGIDPEKLPSGDEAELFRNVGELLKTMTEGLMQAIASRGQIKSEFRLEQTMIAPTRNNPLKFSVSAQEALMRLLGPEDGAYLAGPAAAAEAVDDINAHQMAVLAGTEAALKNLLRRFKPSALEAKFGNESFVGKAVPLMNKAKYWDFFKALYEEVSEATDDDFQKFFGTEFSSAYEKQLQRLKISRKESK